MRRFLTALRRKVAKLVPRRVVLAPVPVRRPVPRSGLTLIEMLVTVAITLIMMAAVVNIFAAVGQSIQDRRATIEVANQLRIARTVLGQDLSRATATTMPPRDPSSGEGYFEIIEGIQTDWKPTRIADGTVDASIGDLELDDYATWLVPKAKAASVGEEGPTLDADKDYRQLGLSGLGDYDDILALTVRSQGEPFIGRFRTAAGVDMTIKSREAEIIWFAIENPPVPRSDPNYLGEPGMRTIYRRVLLIAPWVEPQLQALGVADVSSPEGLRDFYRNHDISVRIDPETGFWVPNSLADLTKRENRFAHAPNYPHGIDVERIRFVDPNGAKSRTPLVPYGFTSDESSLTGPDRRGEDLMLTNVLAFDLRVYDPLARLYSMGGAVVEPCDIGWQELVRTASPDQLVPVGFGAYVDLAYVGDRYGNPSQGTAHLTSVFSTAPHPRSGYVEGAGLGIRSYYDTWSLHYEYDGLNQDRPDLMPDVPNTDDWIDEGTNGVDDDGQFGVDDVGERETSPPYPTPLRGIEVKLRVYEPDSRAVREVSVKQNFTPQ